jgi:hypothetical protein
MSRGIAGYGIATRNTGWEFTDRLFVIDFIKKMVYPTNNAKLKLGG